MYDLRDAIRDAIQSHYHGLIEENKGDPKRLRKVINKVLDKATPSTEVSTLDVEGRTITKEKDIAEALKGLISPFSISCNMDVL